ncbi:hypothetical protein [Spirosoma litoris]
MMAELNVTGFSIEINKRWLWLGLVFLLLAALSKNKEVVKTIGE